MRAALPARVSTKDKGQETTAETATKNPRGRPRVCIKPEAVAQMRSLGASWRQIGKAFQIGTATAMRLYKSHTTRVPNQDVSQAGRSIDEFGEQGTRSLLLIPS